MPNPLTVTIAALAMLTLAPVSPAQPSFQGLGDLVGGAFESSRCPFSQGANSASHAATVSASDIRSKPAARHDASSHSTMNVEVDSSNR